MNYCNIISNVILTQVGRKLTSRVFDNCNEMDNVKVKGGTTHGNSSFRSLLYQCSNVSNIYAEYIYEHCFEECHGLSNCNIKNISDSSCFFKCYSLVNCVAEVDLGDIYGYNQCKRMSNCFSKMPNVNNYGYFNCNFLVNCASNKEETWGSNHILCEDNAIL